MLLKIVFTQPKLAHDPITDATVRIMINSVLTRRLMFKTEAPRTLRTPISLVRLMTFSDTSVKRPVAESVREITPRKAYIYMILIFQLFISWRSETNMRPGY